ncbi:MAG: BrnT family toxin [Crocosphaera sp.]|nr:BrnT family toxin [Crocosphaera sp.]
MDDKYWTAVITYRGENIRIISVRRSKDKEKQSYEQQKRQI